MVVLEQYPHYLYFLTITKSTQDNNGTWQKGEQSWNFLCKCRVERNGQAASITTTDGKSFIFSATVYMPKGTAEKPLQIGTRIIVATRELDTESITEAEIKTQTANGIILIDKPNATFEIGRLHNRMWL